MVRLKKFLQKSGADRRLLVAAATLHVGVAAAIRVLPWRWVQRVLGGIAASRSRGRVAADADVRIVRAVRTVSSMRAGAHCLTDALVAQCLLARAGCESTLCFGVSGTRSDARPFDAHAWLERGTGGIVLGARAVTYERFRHPRRLS